MFEGVNIIKFSEEFSNNDNCHCYLAGIKWKDGYKCCKCGHESYFEGKYAHSRCCKKCKYLESATAHTLFHRLKFPIHKAFYIAFLVVTGKKGISTYELERKLSLRQKTCWTFKTKIVSAMQSSEKSPLTGEVEVDEFYIGKPDQDSIGRKSGNKRQVVLAIQVEGKSIQRPYAKVIPNASSIEFEAFFDTHIHKGASIRTETAGQDINP